MKRLLPICSIIFAFIAMLLVFTPYFKTPPLAIFICSLLGILLGILSPSEHRAMANMGLILSIVSLSYLIFLFWGLAS